MARRVAETEKYQDIDGVPHKRCSTCKTLIPVSEFSSRAASADGLAYSCKTCERKTAQESYKRRRAKKVQQKYYQEHKEEYIERQKERYAENKEDLLAYGKEWRQGVGRDKVNEASKRRSDRIKEQTPGGADYVREEIIERDSVDGVCICQICNEPILDLKLDLQLDHIKTIKDGGADLRDNIRCTHKTCNLTRKKSEA